MSALIKGDGNLRDPRFTTASKVLAEQFCTLIAQLGYRPRKIKEKVGDGMYRIFWYNSSIGLTESGREKSKWMSKEKFNGHVYCVTTRKNHTVFTAGMGSSCP